jgi:predicted AAA+ superfamily ATPase
VRTPKVYVRDSGLLHALLDIHDQEDLLGHPVVGASWEGMLIENILNALPPTARATFYRTAAGAEIDLIIEFGVRERWAIEIKRSISKRSLPHLPRAKQRYGRKLLQQLNDFGLNTALKHNHVIMP